MTPDLVARKTMGTARRWAVPMAIFLAFSLAQPTQAQSGKPSEGGGSLGSVLDETTNNVLRIFGAFLKAIPQFEAPEVLPNGDIIIRRKPSVTPPPKEEDEPDETETRRI